MDRINYKSTFTQMNITFGWNKFELNFIQLKLQLQSGGEWPTKCRLSRLLDEEKFALGGALVWFVSFPPEKNLYSLDQRRHLTLEFKHIPPRAKQSIGQKVSAQLSHSTRVECSAECVHTFPNCITAELIVCTWIDTLQIDELKGIP